jgi:2-phospho-L-lactate guanylyltransferase
VIPASVHESTSGLHDGTLFVVPIKGLSTAKTRLAEALSADLRTRLVTWLILRTVGSLGGRGFAVIADDPDLAALLDKVCFPYVVQRGGGLNEACSVALQKARSYGARFMAVVPVDLKAPERACRLRIGHGVTIVPDLRYRGTNLIVIPTGLDWAFRFGPDSLLLHASEALSVGAGLELVSDPLLQTDLDTGEDLRAWSDVLPEDLRG